MKLRCWDMFERKMLYDTELYEINYYELFKSKKRYMTMPFIAKLKNGDCYVGDLIKYGNCIYEVLPTGIRLLNTKKILEFYPKSVSFKIIGNIYSEIA